MPIDLHAHTTASDGSFSPRELVRHAKERGLKAVAVTDHDTFGGWNEAQDEGAKIGVEVVPGIELSVSDENGKFHLLGFGFSRDSELAQRLGAIQDSRARRNEIIVENLQKMGLKITMEEVREIAGEGNQIGRPQIARALMKHEENKLSSIQEIFDKYLADGKPAVASRDHFTPADAIRMIHEAGGVAIWAHPLRSPSERSAPVSLEDTERMLQIWKNWGLDGIEIFYGDYTRAEAEWSAQMAQKYDFLASGGSDFHGITKPNVVLGEVNEKQSVPDWVLDALKARTGNRN